MPNEYLYQDLKGPNTEHPDAMIRIGSVVNYFGTPESDPKSQLSFAKSFATVGSADAARKLVAYADDSRTRLAEGLDAKKISAERVVTDSKRYIPLIHSILLSCKVQPEAARLDEKLAFNWRSGIEFVKKGKKKPFFGSEAIMYDLTMAVVCEGLGHAIGATDSSIQGDFAAAARKYATAAGIFDFLAKDHLPKWIAKGSNVDEDELPVECSKVVAQGLSELFQANGQQMAVATVLMKPDKPNYALLAKLCLGISEALDNFVSNLRKNAASHVSRMDPDFFTMIAFQIEMQKSLSLYFQARNLWEEDEHGMAIALLSEATVAAQTRSSKATSGLPDVSRTAALHPLKDDLLEVRKHMQTLLAMWEKENSSVYFASVPQKVPAGKKLQNGLEMKRKEAYALEDVDPILLVLPGTVSAKKMPSPMPVQRSDSDLARELQFKLNAGLE